MELLLDNLELAGNDLNGFTRANRKMSEITYELSVKPCSLTFLSLCTAKPVQREDTSYWFRMI